MQWISSPGRCADVAAPSNEPVRWAEALRAVICNNTAVRQGDALTEQAQASLDRARGQRQPAVTLSAGVDGARGLGAGGSAAARLDWVLFDFGSSGAAVRQQRQALTAVLDEQQVEVFSAVAQAAQLHTAAQAAQGRMEAAAINLRSAKDNSRVATARQRGGAATLSDRLQAETASAQAQLEYGRAMGQWLSARGSLALAMGRPADHALKLVPFDSREEKRHDLPLDLPALIDEARQSHPRINASRARLAEARERSDSVAAARWGSISLNARTARERTSSTIASNNTSAALEWSLPLFDRGVQQSQMRESRGQERFRSLGLEDAERQIAQQVWQEGQALMVEREGLRSSRAVLEMAETALLVAGERFRLGAGSFSDLLAAQRAVTNARLQLVEGRANLSLARWRLAAAVGRFGTP